MEGSWNLEDEDIIYIVPVNGWKDFDPALTFKEGSYGNLALDVDCYGYFVGIVVKLNVASKRSIGGGE